MRKILVALLILVGSFVTGQIPEPQPNTYVNDLSGKLSPQQIELLNQSIRIIEDSTGVQLAMILTNDIVLPIEDYAREVGRTWHVGNADNGLVYVCVINSRQQRLEVANHLQGTIPDIVAGEIIRNAKNFYKQGQYYEGLQTIVSGIQAQVMPVAKEQKALITPNKPVDGFVWFMAILLFGGIVVIVRWSLYRKFKKVQSESQDRKLESERQDAEYYARTGNSYPAASGLYSPPIVTPTYYPTSNDSPSYFSSGSSTDYSSSSSDSSSSSYGDWGSSSTDTSSSSDSGYSGGGSSDSW